MATDLNGNRPALVLYCAYAQREGISGVKALGMFRHAGGTVADSVFYQAWSVASVIPAAFAMEGLRQAAIVASEEKP